MGNESKPSATDLLEKIQEAREYAVMQAESKRNQAIGALGFAVLVLTLVSYLKLDGIVDRQLDALGRERVLARAELAAGEAEKAQSRAQQAAASSEQLLTQYQDRLNRLPSRLELQECSDAGWKHGINERFTCPSGKILVGFQAGKKGWGNFNLYCCRPILQ